MDDMLTRDYYLVCDRSSSMLTADLGTTRWNYLKEAIISFAQKCSELDPDGFSLVFFNSGTIIYDNVTPEKTNTIFSEVEPAGGTAFTQVIKKVFDKLKGPSTIIVLTDGEPTDSNDKKTLAQLIIQQANKLSSDDELAIMFLQIGKDPSASVFLQKLDDELQSLGAKFDIVDTKTSEEYEGTPLKQLLTDAISD
jgi:hypothetical protein